MVFRPTGTCRKIFRHPTLPEVLPVVAGESSGNCRKFAYFWLFLRHVLEIFTASTVAVVFSGMYREFDGFRHLPEFFPAQYTAGRFSGTCRTFFRHVPEVHFIFPTVLVMPEDKMSLRQLPEGKIHLR